MDIVRPKPKTKLEKADPYEDILRRLNEIEESLAHIEELLENMSALFDFHKRRLSLD